MWSAWSHFEHFEHLSFGFCVSFGFRDFGPELRGEWRGVGDREWLQTWQTTGGHFGHSWEIM
jgi:hypothetical protein